MLYYMTVKGVLTRRDQDVLFLLFLMILGVIMAVVGVLVARPAYEHLLDVPAEILDMTVLYFRIYSVGLIFQFGYNIFSDSVPMRQRTVSTTCVRLRS